MTMLVSVNGVQVKVEEWLWFSVAKESDGFRRDVDHYVVEVEADSEATLRHRLLRQDPLQIETENFTFVFRELIEGNLALAGERPRMIASYKVMGFRPLRKTEPQLQPAVRRKNVSARPIQKARKVNP